jgi:hypothetical protein
MVSVPFGVAESRRGKITLHPAVIKWMKANIRGKWLVHRNGSDENDRIVRYGGDRPLTAEASFSAKEDATLFKLFWGGPNWLTEGSDD